MIYDLETQLTPTDLDVGFLVERVDGNGENVQVLAVQFEESFLD